VIATMNFVDFGDGQPPTRAFVCTPNSWGYPAGDRSGKLEQIEEPHLGKLITKLTRPIPATIHEVAVAKEKTK
jgi:hypothetical protein